MDKQGEKEGEEENCQEEEKECVVRKEWKKLGEWVEGSGIGVNVNIGLLLLVSNSPHHPP